MEQGLHKCGTEDLEPLTAEQMARNRRAAEQEEKTFNAELAARQ